MEYPISDATEYLQKELDDPLYKVVYDDETKTYDVLRYRGNIDGDTGYYALQKSYPHPIDQRVVDDFKANNLHGVELKLIFAEQQRQKDAIRKKAVEKVGLILGDMARDLSRLVVNPREIFIMNRILKKKSR
jgi:hypothetical protein